MRFAADSESGIEGLAAAIGQGTSCDYLESDVARPSRLFNVILCGDRHPSVTGQTLLGGPQVDLDFLLMLPTLPVSEKIICVGPTYFNRSTERGYEPPGRPTVFVRFASSVTSCARRAKDSVARIRAGRF
jgi:hypothetical protein